MFKVHSGDVFARKSRSYAPRFATWLRALLLYSCSDLLPYYTVASARAYLVPLNPDTPASDLSRNCRYGSDAPLRIRLRIGVA